MLSFSLQYNFPPLSMRITNGIVKKKKKKKTVHPCWNNCPQKSLTPGDFFCSPRALSYKSLFLTNQIEETDKQRTLRRQVTDDHSHIGDTISIENSLELSTTR